VVDQSGAPIADARVTVTADGAAAPALTTTSDQAGEFELALERHVYTIAVDAPGFTQTTERINGAQTRSSPLRFVLQVAGVRESVSVTATAGYDQPAISTATRTLTPLVDVPQSVTVVTESLIEDQLMSSLGDVVRYVPGMSAHQGENNRDDVVIRGNRSSADFFLNGVRDDVQYYRDLYNVDRVEALKGPNAMIFGRGGGGGVINRIVKEPVFRPVREIRVQTGAYGNKRLAADAGQAISDTVAFRMNGMFEDSGSFRDGVDLERAGFNPTLTFSPNAATKVTIGYEYLRDTRVADRGITSFDGRPADVDRSTYYGNPDESHVRARVNLGSALVEHRFGAATIRNRTMLGGYDRFYQNFVPGAASADRTLVTLTAYNNATNRTNLFNQTDIAYPVSAGSMRHTLLAGAEIGRQFTDNFRNTGFFNNTAPSELVPFDHPSTATPVVFRQNATDADNHLKASVTAVFAQDHVELSRHLQVIGGLRFDRFVLNYHNNRTGQTLERADNLVSPRAGVVFKPILPVSIYTSYSVSYLPSSGDQFSSLTAITRELEPEKFRNYEVGVKWEARPSLSVTTAVYRLDRTNTRSTDANDPTRIVQTGSQRTNGFEAGLTGSLTDVWSIAGGYAYQDAVVTSATASAREGAVVGQVPHHTVSLWNNYKVHPRVSVALGIVHRSDMFAAIDNTVTLPGYTRADLATYVTLRKGVRIQANLENAFDRKYFANADSNTNISPGSPRALRVGLSVEF
jgi:catecholate siderophore receptor